MKKIFLAFLCSSSLVACQTKYDGYILNGNIGGNSEGMKVQLVNEAVYPPVTIDSTVIKNGRFQLKGKVDRPGMYQLIIDKTGQDDPSQMLASRFYLEIRLSVIPVTSTACVLIIGAMKPSGKIR